MFIPYKKTTNIAVVDRFITIRPYSDQIIFVVSPDSFLRGSRYQKPQKPNNPTGFSCFSHCQGSQKLP